MLAFRAWEIRTNRIVPERTERRTPEVSFRQVEKSMLYLTKHIVQGIVLTCAKYWFILTTKAKKWIVGKWPKAHSLFKTNTPSTEPRSPSFVKRTVIESKAKIKRIKERVKREHGQETQKTEEQV